MATAGKADSSGTSVLFWLVAAIITLVVVAVGLYQRSNSSKRLSKRFIARLTERIPDAAIVEDHVDFVVFKVESLGDGEFKQYFDNMRYELSELAIAPGSERELEIFDHHIDGVASTYEAVAIDPEEDRQRAFPRLAPMGFDEQLGAPNRYPSRPVAALSLSIFYVLDRPNRVVYLDVEGMETLGLSEDKLHELALQNLVSKTPEDLVQTVLSEKKTIIFQAGDTLEAARILVLPQMLKPGEALAVSIMDRDTLMISIDDGDVDWDKLASMDEIANPVQRLLARPVRVTSEGFEIK